eukprot:9144439-Ditylum_brightwellii.AAC.1
MFVAFELQIGLEAEVNDLREDHVSYEEGRILKAQPLLKAYKEAQAISPIAIIKRWARKKLMGRERLHSHQRDYA